MSRIRLHAAHLIIASIGLLSLCRLLATLVLAGVYLFPTRFLPWNTPFVFPEKPSVLLTYVVACPALFIYLCFGATHLRGISRGTASRSFLDWFHGPQRLMMYAAIAAACNLLPWVVGELVLIPPSVQLKVLMLAAGCWVLFVILCCSGRVIRLGVALTRHSSIVLVVVCLQFALAMTPFIVIRPSLVNDDYYDIPAATYLQDSASGERVLVDNFRFINEHSLYGMPKYDPRIDRGGDPAHSQLASVKVQMTPSLLSYLQTKSLAAYTDRLDLFVPPKNDEERLLGCNFVLDRESGELIATGRIAESEFERLRLTVAEEDQRALDSWYALNDIKQMGYAQRNYDDMERQFLLLNKSQIDDQVRAYGYVHHHNFLLGPINELALGRPSDQINSQYGYLNLLALKQLMLLCGGISWNTYQPLLYMFYGVYLAASIAVVWWVLRDARLLTIFTVVGVTGLLLVGFKAISLAPGYNPIRHLLDLPVLLVLHAHFRRDNLATLILLVAGLALAILNNAMTGAILAVAVTIAVVLHRAIERKRLSRCLIVELPLLLATLSFAVITPFYDAMFVYYLEGLMGFPMNWSVAVIAMAAMILTAFTLALGWDMIPVSRRYLLIATTIYALGTFFYFVWCSLPGHLLAYSIVYAFAGILYLKALFDILDARGDHGLRQTLTSLAMIVSIGSNLVVAAGYAIEVVGRERVFFNHEVHEWSNPRARIRTTMPEELFAEATELVSRHARAPGIHILSRYDNFVPFLSGHYSAMPFPEILTFLATQTEVDRCAQVIEIDKPDRIFVDTDIHRTAEFDLINPETPTQGDRTTQILATTRVARRAYLREIFDRIRADYEPLEEGRLLTVWKRRAPPATAVRVP